MNRVLLSIALLVAFCATAGAEILTFEGTTVTGANRELDVDGANQHGPSLINYAGYDWLGMLVAKPLVSIGNPRQIIGFTDESDPDFEEDGPQPIVQPVDAGFDRSLVSGDTIAFTKAFAGSTSVFASIKARPGDVNFNFFSTYMTAGWRDNIGVTVTGKRDGATVYTRNLTIGDDGPVLVNLDFLDIDEIQFLTSGGTFLYPNGNQIGSFINPGNSAFSTPTLAFDDMNLSPVPVPAAAWLLGSGLLGLLGLRRKA